MKKILLSLAALGVVGAVVGGATVAFYGDVETSTGNTFTAGGIDLKVDSVSHYNGMICTSEGWQPEGDTQVGPEHFPQPGAECDGTWAETDLQDGVQKYFNFLDLKPGDWGEDTISLHVYNNDAWGQFEIASTTDRDNTCTEPEQTAENNGCVEPDGDGEIDNYLRFTGWVDQGSIPGFQCGSPDLGDAQCEDPTEGDNIYQDDVEGPKFWDGTLIGDLGPFDLSEVLSAAYVVMDCENLGGAVDGHNEYGPCQGFAQDGRMVESTTYYFGLAWDLDLQETGNDAMTDTFGADMIFRVEQHRNNPNPFGP